MNACDEFEVAVEMRRHGALGAPDAVRLAGHLATCASCRAFDEMTRNTEEVMGLSADELAGGMDWDRVAARVRAATEGYRIAIRVALRVRACRPLRTGPLEREPAAVRHADPLVRGEDAARIQAALAELTAEHRVVISLFAIDGLGHGEIAAILGIPEGTVWSRLHLARKRLAGLLAG